MNNSVVKIFAMGGLDENGKNLYVLEVNDDIFVFESGLKYPESSMPGIDMIIPDVGYLIKNRKRVKAYFISHGHDDIMGGLPYIVKDVPAPIYCSKMTEEMILDSAKRFKVNVKMNFVTVKSGDTVNISGHECRFFSTTHSVSDSLGIAVNTPNGYVVYTGDYIIDYGALPNYRTDIHTLMDIAKQDVLCLLSESIACDIPGHTSPKHKLTPHVEKYFSRHEGRILMTFYTQNLFGIREAIDLAIKYRRKILLFDDDIKNIYNRFNEKGDRIPSNLLVDIKDIEKIENDRILILISGVGEKLYNTLEKIAIDSSLLRIRPTDEIIIASPSVPGIEVQTIRVIDELYKTGANVLNLKRKDVVSMHAHEEDIKMMLSLLHPKYFMPVKGEFRHLIKNAQIAVNMNIGYNHTNCFVFDNGMVANFENGVFKGTTTIEVGDVLIDGVKIGDVGSSVISDRQKLSDNGVLVLGIAVSKLEKRIVAGPDVQMRGLIFLKDADDFLSGLVGLFEKLINDAIINDIIGSEDNTNRIKEQITTYVRRSTGKDPVVIVSISLID